MKRMGKGKGCRKRDAVEYRARAAGAKSYHRYPPGFQVPGKQTRI